MKPKRKRTALIVEDDPTLRTTMSEHVARMDLQVLPASHYAAALSHLASGTPDLACVDIGLPTESGYDLCEYIRGPLGLKSLPIIVMSECGSPEDMAYAEEAGANAFLVKPFVMAELGANIAALMDVRVVPIGAKSARFSKRSLRSLLSSAVDAISLSST